MSFKAAAEAYFKRPSAKTWEGLAHKIVPGSMRTVWQGWIRVDGSAPTELKRDASGRHHWPVLPDPFTVRRAIREIRKGNVPVGWWWLKEERPAAVPGRRAQKKERDLDNAAIADVILGQLTRSPNGGTKLKAMIGAHSVVFGDEMVQFKWRSRARNGANTAVIQLEETNLYSVEFWSIHRGAAEKIARFDDVHADDLKRLFERETGLAVSL